MAIRSWLNWWPCPCKLLLKNSHCCGLALVMWLWTPVSGVDITPYLFLRISWYTNNKRCFYCNPPALPFSPLSPSVIRTVVGRVQVCMDWWSSSVRDQCYRRPRSNSKLGTRAKRRSRLSHLLPNRLTINTGKNISDAWLTRLSKKLGSSHFNFTIVQPSNALSYPNLDI